MTKHIGQMSRRRFIAAALGSGAAVAAPSVLTGARAADELKIATFYALSGPGSLFGPTQTAVTKLAMDQINAAGGVGGRKVTVIPNDGGAPPAEAAKAAIRMMLRDKVDIVVGSHDSAVREAIVAALKGQVPYVYTPLYEGGECNPNVYVTADTPQQQVQPSITYLAETLAAKSYYLIGNDYVWPRKTNEQAKRYIEEAGGAVVGEEYVPLGAPNKFEDAVTRIKAKQPDLVVLTLVGGDNINFNRTFAGFGLDKSIKRISYLLEEQTLLGNRRREQRRPVQRHVLFRERGERRQRRVQGELPCGGGRRGTAARHDRRRHLRRRLLRQGPDREGGRHGRRQADGGGRKPRVPDSHRLCRHDQPTCRQGHVPCRVQGDQLRDRPDLQGGGARADLRLNARPT